MRITVLLCLLLLVGVVSGAPVQKLKHPERKFAPKSRVMKRSYQARNGLCCRLRLPLNSRSAKIDSEDNP